MMKELWHGALYLFRGIKLFYSDKHAWKYAIPPFLLMTLIYIAAGVGLFFLAGSFSVDALPGWLNGTLRGIFYFAAALLSFFLLPIATAATLYEICGGIFFDYLTGFWEKKYFNFTGTTSWKETLIFIWDSVHFGCGTLFFLTLFSLLGLIFPVVGQILLFWFMGYSMAIAILSSTAFNHGIRIKQLLKIRKGSGLIRGFGIMAYALSLIPFGIIIFLPGMIIGGVELFHAELEDNFTTSRR